MFRKRLIKQTVFFLAGSASFSLTSRKSILTGPGPHAGFFGVLFSFAFGNCGRARAARPQASGIEILKEFMPVHPLP